MSKSIPLSVPSISGKEWKYVKECLDTGWVSSLGKYVGFFEKKISDYTDSRFTVACVNGTAALHIALIVAGVKPDDEVIAPTLTFIASVNTVKYVGADPIFMDCDDYYNIDAVKTIEFIEDETEVKNGYTYNKKTGKKISAIIPVHVFGNAVNLEKLFSLCKERNIKVIEDATESLGTKYIKGSFSGKYTGTVGDIGCYSFNGNKIITTGGGGMIVTDNEEYAEKARYLTTQAKDDPIRYIHNEIGYNYRLTNIQAAMGVAQLEQLDKFIEIKKKNYEFYKDKISSIEGLKIAGVPVYAQQNHWLYALQIDKGIYGKDREKLMKTLEEKGIQTRPVWQLNHLQKPYRNCQAYKIEKAIKLHKITLNIPCSVGLEKKEIKKILEFLN
jgi:aminotransferase in exopolysaccharide biosynthesis